jgi:hypothetical protein
MERLSFFERVLIVRVYASAVREEVWIGNASPVVSFAPAKIGLSFEWATRLA